MLTIGFILNPYAGIGGALAMKGSDHINIQQVLAGELECVSADRAGITLKGLQVVKEHIRWLSAPALMGEDVLRHHGFTYEVIGDISDRQTSAGDTERLVKLLLAEKIDLLLFVGGDGTARNVVNALAESHYPDQLTLGIPAGVKMHSGVYTVSPQAATAVINGLASGEPVSTSLEEVRDIDEQALREGRLNSRYYGELWVPNDDRYVQQVKNTSRPDEVALQMEIAAHIVDDMDDETLYIIGCGSTPKAVMDELHLPNTLLGVDVVLGRELLAMDVTAHALETLLEQYPFHPVKLLVTAIGGQGHIIGRGNQQLSTTVLQRAGKSGICVLITPNKLAEFEQRPLLIDSGDPSLDQQWSGLITIYTGYQQTSVYPLSGG